jgi:murein DD-endopeptidase MepM/ murein hydrolase activator NlpD
MKWQCFVANMSFAVNLERNAMFRTAMSFIVISRAIVSRAMVSRYGLIAGILLLCAGCSGDRALLPVSDAPLRERIRDVPPDGIIKVSPGDTIYTLANRYQVTPRRIILANNLSPPYILNGVRTLNVPKPRAHIASASDTIETIASRYKVSRQEVIALNNFVSPYRLHKGMSIAIPRRIDYSLLDVPISPQSTTTSRGTEADIEFSTPKTSPNTAKVTYSDRVPDFAWPVDGQIIENFGPTARGVHNDGVNIAASEGASVRASQSGEVAFVGSGLKAFGNLVLIKHHNGWITAYAHLSDVRVNEGDYLDRGTIIGGVGQTGRVNSPQLHFEIRRSRTPVNPRNVLS